MLFSSIIFLFVFLPVVLFAYYVLLSRSRKAQNMLLLIASLLFYAWGEPKFVLIMMASILGNWLFGLAVDKYRGSLLSRVIIVSMLVYNLSILFLFKYAGFTVENLNAWLGTSLTVPDISLPLGLSFFTFQAISYVVDVYRKRGDVQRNPLNLGLYIALFPQLVAGPIVRYETIADQIDHRRETMDQFAEGVCRFIVGLGKKVLIANSMAIVADHAFSMQADELTLSFAWLGAVAYSLQILFDFSGYSDMAIGLGKMFGFHFLENFNYPYISTSISEFWRRWHISLGTWFRDYVYIPLGGSRVNSKGRLVWNLFIVWALTGIWHGANWTFVAWGLMYFVLITYEKLTGFERTVKLNALRRVYTLLFVMLGWVLFRSVDLGHAVQYLKALFGAGEGGILDEQTILYADEYKVIFLLGILFSTPIAGWFAERIPLRSSRWGAICYTIACLAVLITSVSFIVKGSYNPFIYFNF
ncbi:MBOAT family O-acyltransferase [Paenibacillus marinisediminis]